MKIVAFVSIIGLMLLGGAFSRRPRFSADDRDATHTHYDDYSNEDDEYYRGRYEDPIHRYEMMKRSRSLPLRINKRLNVDLEDLEGRFYEIGASRNVRRFFGDKNCVCNTVKLVMTDDDKLLAVVCLQH